MLKNDTRNDFYVCIEPNNPVLIGSCLIIPKAHKITVFDLSYEEWEATKQLIDETKYMQGVVFEAG